MQRPIIVVLFVVAALVALAGAGLWWFQKRTLPVSFTQDAVQVIAYEASDRFEKNPGTTREEIERLIKSLHEASVINLKIDAHGQAVDPFGKAFQVEHRMESGKSVTTVLSAGPDREFETRDDIEFTHKVETVPDQDDQADAG